MPRVLIAGCGYVGTVAANLFRENGWDVEGWTHSAESARTLEDKPYIVRPVDISERAAVAAARSDFDLAVHCASSGGGNVEDYRKVYLEGARHLLEELQPRKLIFTSSTSVYAQTDGQWVNEESPADPLHESGRILRATETLVQENGGVVLRLAGIYGPGRCALLSKFLSGQVRIEGSGSRFLNQIHRDDAAAAIVLVATLSERGIFNVADDEPITQRAACEWLAEKLQKPLPQTARAIQRKRGESNKRVSNRKLRSLGWTPRFPNFPTGLENSVLPAAGNLD